jgi:hypothetical protein
MGDDIFREYDELNDRRKGRYIDVVKVIYRAVSSIDNVSMPNMIINGNRVNIDWEKTNESILPRVDELIKGSLVSLKSKGEDKPMMVLFVAMDRFNGGEPSNLAFALCIIRLLGTMRITKEFRDTTSGDRKLELREELIKRKLLT